MHSRSKLRVKREDVEETPEVPDRIEGGGPIVETIGQREAIEGLGGRSRRLTSERREWSDRFFRGGPETTMVAKLMRGEDEGGWLGRRTTIVEEGLGRDAGCSGD